MRALKPWVEALNLNPNQVAQWALDVPKHESVTFWCLDRGLVRSQDYFEWAKNFYQLPFLDSEYFQKPANRDLWLKIQTVANWNPELLPLEEWDGVVFVGCVEPPENIQWSFPVAYVLVSARDLKIHWERLQSEPTKVTMPSINLNSLSTPKLPSDQAENAPAPTSTPAPVQARAKPTAPPVASHPQKPPAPKPTSPPVISEQVQKASATPPPTSGSPLQLNLNFATGSQPITPAAEASEVPSLSMPSSPAEETSVSIPGGLNLDLGNINLGDPESMGDAPEGLNIDTSQSDAPEGLAIPEDHSVFDQDDVPTGIFPNPELSLGQEAPPDLNPPVHPKPKGAPVVAVSPQGTTNDPDDIPDQSVSSFTMVSAPVGSASSESGMIDSDRVAPKSIEAAQDQREAVAWVFQQLRQYFHYSWLFTLEGDTLTPQYWEKSARKIDDTATDPINLTQPSLFRIVARTRMPYHGHIVDNPINTGFFKKWGLRSTPEHVTATPVLNGDRPIAILLAAGKKPEKSEAVLRFVERLAPSISLAMSKTKKAA